MVARSPKKLKVTTKEERLKKEQDDEYKRKMFQKYMIHIGQWIMIDNQVSINPKSWFVPKEQIESGFKAYLKK